MFLRERCGVSARFAAKGTAIWLSRGGPPSSSRFVPRELSGLASLARRGALVASFFAKKFVIKMTHLCPLAIFASQGQVLVPTGSRLIRIRLTKRPIFGVQFRDEECR